MESKFDYIKENLDEIKKMISEGKPLAEMCRRFDVKQETLQKHLHKLGIDYKGNMQRKGMAHPEARVDAERYFRNEQNVSTSTLRKILIRDGYKEEKCECCGLSEWMGKKIPLELHHKDFNHYNNNLDNLQILCSNCHMQAHGYNNTK